MYLYVLVLLDIGKWIRLHNRTFRGECILVVVVSSLLGAFVVVMTGTLVSFFTLGGVNGVEADLVLPLFFPSSCVKEELVLNIFFNLLNPEFCCSGEPTELSSDLKDNVIVQCGLFAIETS